MDLDYLRQRRVESIRRAETAQSSSARLAHEGLARFYAEWIGEEERRLAGEQFTPRWPST